MSERLSEEERAALGTALICRGDVYAAVEAIVARRVAVAEIAGQMKHITADVARADQPVDVKEEFIADLRARLSHTEAERDEARNGWAALSAEVRRRVPETLLNQPPTASLRALLAALTQAPADASEGASGAVVGDGEEDHA